MSKTCFYCGQKSENLLDVVHKRGVKLWVCEYCFTQFKKKDGLRTIETANSGGLISGWVDWLRS